MHKGRGELVHITDLLVGVSENPQPADILLQNQTPDAGVKGREGGGILVAGACSAIVIVRAVL